MTKNELSRALASYQYSLTPLQLDRLWTFHSYLREENARLNLTRIHNFEEIVRKHYVDSLIVPPLLEKFGPEGLHSFPARVLDFGSGPGLPGIPLAIMYADTHFILAESRKNRADFLEEVVRKCDLPNVEIIGRRLAPADGLKVDAVIARAVSGIPDLLSRSGYLVKKDGYVILWKGPNCTPEIEAAEELSQGCTLELDHGYSLPRSVDERRLIVYRITDPDYFTGISPDRADLITSRTNEKFKSIIALQSARGIKKARQCIVSGKRNWRDLHPDYFVAHDLHSAEDLPPDASVIRFNKDLFNECDLFGTHEPLAICAAPELEQWKPSQSRLTLLLPFQDPENVGSAIRTAVAMGVEEIVLLAEAANPYLPRAIRAAAGACFHTELRKGPSIADLPEFLKENSIKSLVALSSGEGDQLRDYKFPEKVTLLCGMEGPGLQGLYGDWIQKVHIPIQSVESLNASVALGMACMKFNVA